MIGAYLVNNLITGGAVITVSSEDSSYPKNNLYDLQAANMFRSQSITSLTIEVDLGAAAAIDTVAIINHNFTQSVGLSLKADNSSPPTTTRAAPAYRLRDIWAGFTQVSARYWLLTITDSNSSNLALGQLILGNRVDFPRGRRIANNYKPAVQRQTIGGETYAGLLWTYHLFERRQFNPTFRVGSAAELAILSNLDSAAYGDNFPFLYIPDNAGADCYYVRKDREFAPREIDLIAGGEIAHDVVLTLTEESRGLNILE